MSQSPASPPCWALKTGFRLLTESESSADVLSTLCGGWGCGVSIEPACLTFYPQFLGDPFSQKLEASWDTSIIQPPTQCHPTEQP